MSRMTGLLRSITCRRKAALNQRTASYNQAHVKRGDISTRTLQRWHKQGFGPRRSIGKRFYYIKSEIQEWIASHGRGGKRSDSSERSLKNTNSIPGDKSTAINCTKLDTPMAFSTPSNKMTAIDCTKVDAQNAVTSGIGNARNRT